MTEAEQGFIQTSLLFIWLASTAGGAAFADGSMRAGMDWGRGLALVLVFSHWWIMLTSDRLMRGLAR